MLVQVMIRNLNLIFILSCLVLQAQDNQSRLIGTWVFQSMTTITKAEREEVSIVYKDDKNLETLTFEVNGMMLYRALTDGDETEGNGSWVKEGNFITIIVESDTTHGPYDIEDNMLTIIVTEDETDEFFGYTTILKYSLQ